MDHDCRSSLEVESTDLERPLLNQRAPGENLRNREPLALAHSQLLLASAFILFLLSVAVSILTWCLSRQTFSGSAPLARVSINSPLLEDVTLSKVKFNNSFGQPSKYRGPPTPELEAEWDKLWNYGDISVPHAMLSELTSGEATDKVWRTVPEALGGGYLAGIEVFHQLHCLNMIRQYTWGNYYQRNGLQQPISLSTGLIGSRMHVDHCIETLRTTLMCHGDTTPMLREIDESAPMGSRAVFSTVHKCANFEALQEGMLRRAVMKDRSTSTGMMGAHGGHHQRE